MNTTPRPMKRYTIYFDPNHDHDYSRAWSVVDHQLTGNNIIEGGYSKAGAIAAANFHNYKALGAGPWRPYRKPRSYR